MTDHFAKEELLDVLAELKRKFDEDDKKNQPVLVQVKNMAILLLMTYLPFFWGKGNMKGNHQTDEDEHRKKPVLILATNPTSLYNLQVMFGKDSVLIKDGIF